MAEQKKTEVVPVVAEKVSEGAVSASLPGEVAINVSDSHVVISFPAGDEIRNSTLHHLANILQQLQRFKESNAVLAHVAGVGATHKAIDL